MGNDALVYLAESTASNVYRDMFPFREYADDFTAAVELGIS